MSESDVSSNDAMPRGPISIYDVIVIMADQIASIAWQKLGLQPDPLTGRTEKDLAEAKVAIDLTTHLATFVQEKLDGEDQRRMHNLIRDLRINYVEKSKEGSE